MASGTPVPHRIYDTMTVIKACWGFGRTSATMAPVAAATIGATIGRSQAAVMDLSSVV